MTALGAATIGVQSYHAREATLMSEWNIDVNNQNSWDQFSITLPVLYKSYMPLSCTLRVINIATVPTLVNRCCAITIVRSGNPLAPRQVSSAALQVDANKFLVSWNLEHVPLLFPDDLLSFEIMPTDSDATPTADVQVELLFYVAGTNTPVFPGRGSPRVPPVPVYLMGRP